MRTKPACMFGYTVQPIEHLSAQTQLIMTQNTLNSSIHYIAMHFNGWNAYFCDRVHSLMKRKVFFLAVQNSSILLNR